ncbi:MAG: serine/threonine protein kinase [Acidobacteriia bacterium]|nr:serine/threonine protein kinase [Terriglobia bacterium]
MSEETTRRIGDYEILGVLGRGGMGKVFKVRNVISDRIEAMKILLPDLAGRQDLADRFLREIKVLASLNHPNIASLQTALTLNNQLVMVMEYVEGMTLGERLEQGPIPPTEAVNYTEQVLGALSYAHRRNIIHRDIKPANMMLTPEGAVKLMDFGIARSSGDTGLTSAGTTIGSLYYMSPEQVKGETTDARSDLYSLGVSLYEMVTGQRPFRADSDYSIMAAHVQELPKPPVELRSDLPAALNEIILTAIAKEPGRRFQSADAFRNALSSLRGQLPAAFAVNQSLSPVAPSNPVAAGATAILQDAGAPISRTEPSAAPFEPPAQSEAVPSVLQLSARQKTHRGLYMSLGALVVLVVLVVAGIYVPRTATTKANDQAQGTQKKANDSSAGPASSSSVPDADKTKARDSADANKTEAQESADQSAHDATQPSASNADLTIPPGDSTAPKQVDQNQRISTADGARPTKKHALNVESKVAAAPGKGRQDKQVVPAAGGAQQGAGQDAGSARADAVQLEALEEQADQISSRVNSINDSLDNLRNQQSAKGYGLRTDIASAQELMKTHLAKAQAALQNQDAAGAKKYLDLAEGDAARIDKFLGH